MMDHFRWRTDLGNGWMVSTVNLDHAGVFQLRGPWETAVIPVDEKDPREPLEVGHRHSRSEAVDFHDEMVRKWIAATNPKQGT